MIEDLLGELAASYRAGHSLQDILTQEVTERFLQSPQMAAAIDRIDGSFLYPAETARLYAGENFVVLGQRDGWIASLSTHKEISRLIYSSAGPLALCTARPGATTTLEIYDVPGVGVHGPARIRASSLDPARVVTAPYGQMRTIDFRNEIVHLAQFSEGAVWLRITAPPEAPYTHAFSSSDGAYIYSTFSSHQSTGIDFVARLLKDIALSQDAEILSDPVDHGNMLAVLTSLSRSQMCMDVSRWTLAQAALELDQEVGLGLLSDLSRGGGELAGKALAALETLALQEVA